MIENNSDESDDEKENADYYFTAAPEDLQKPRRFQYTSQDLIAKTNIRRSLDFEASPSILHFTGFIVGKEYNLDVNVINCSKYKERMNILPLNSSVFLLDYKLSGSLAAGLCQKITVKFTPKEYKYSYDVIRIHGKEDDLLIPIHAYPVTNVVDFPHLVTFSPTPLCEYATKTIVLRCSIPVAFYYELDVVRPHPYFVISPLKGVIPANGELPISVTFSPVTLGTCSTTIRLNIAQHGYTPVECLISAKAVSGLIENRELKQAENSIRNYIKKKELSTGSSLGTTTFPKSMFISQTLEMAGPEFPHDKVDTATSKSVSMMLSSTFRKNDLGKTLEDVVIDAKLSEKVGKDVTRQGFLKLRGPGAGAAFDPGAQWLTSSINEKRMRLTKNGIPLKHSSTILPPPDDDRLIEGLRVPPNLDNMPGVNFVITQEIGKLKPKDLRAAIERNVADRERRAAEQAKMRDEGGGAGGLDINGILAEDRLNSIAGDPMRRQLRELAFLADIDEVNKLEIEKGFRVSNEYIGSTMLSSMDIEVILAQRVQNKTHKERDAWRLDQSRTSTQSFTPFHLYTKAGTDASTATKLLQILQPSFDSNKNDIWSKRLNTLRKFMGLVSRWLIRKRVDMVFKKMAQKFKDAGAVTREEVQEFVRSENENCKSNGGSADAAKLEKQSTEMAYSSSIHDPISQKPQTLATLVCSLSNKDMQIKLTTAISNAKKQFDISSTMVRRVLFPKFLAEENSTRSEVASVDVKNDTKFDDRTFFPIKLRPEYIFMGYEPFQPYTVPMYFPAYNDRVGRIDAREEGALRPPAMVGLKALDLLAGLPPLPESLLSISKVLHDQKKVAEGNNAIFNLEDDLNYPLPDWFTSKSEWPQQELDSYRPRPELRVYTPMLKTKEADPSWEFRPFAEESREQLRYADDQSLRTEWLNATGFLSTNIYMLGGCESRTARSEPPPLGPLLTQSFLQDIDRHASGLHCFEIDHSREYIGPDLDVRGMQTQSDPADDLTDSDSDDEDGYVPLKPSIHTIRKLLAAPLSVPVEDIPKDSKVKGKPKPTEVVIATPVAAPQEPLDTDAFSLAEADRKQDQVELMRDRKILDMENALRKEREGRTTKLSMRLEQISNSSTCALHALSVQQPFQLYEDDVYEIEDRTMPAIMTSFVESSGSMMTGTTGPFSPDVKGMLSEGFSAAP